MQYEVTIRHTRPIRHGEGAVYYRDTTMIEADSEEQVFDKVEFAGIWDAIDHIDSADHTEEGLQPFSVDTGHGEFRAENDRAYMVDYDPREDMRWG